MNAIIVDDEPLARDVLETYLERMPDVNLVATCSNAFEANQALKDNQVDLMFLDIQMPQLTGMDFLRTLQNPPMVIFTTAYSEYAIEGFELDALDYLLKPISFDRFVKAVNRAKEQKNLQTGGAESAVATEPADAQGESDLEEDFIFVKADKKLIKINYDDVLYIEGLKDYVIIRCNDNRVITLQTMKSLEARLPSKIFKRIHRSYIINMSKVEAVMGNMIEITEKGAKKHLPIGKNYREELQGMVNKNRL